MANFPAHSTKSKQAVREAVGRERPGRAVRSGGQKAGRIPTHPNLKSSSKCKAQRRANEGLSLARGGSKRHMEKAESKAVVETVVGMTTIGTYWAKASGEQLLRLARR